MPTEAPKYHIIVKKEHIASGTPADNTSCPIALAIREEIPGVQKVSVGSDAVEFSINGDHVAYTLPRAAISFIVKFDDSEEYKTPEPFEFDLVENIPQEA